MCALKAVDEIRTAVDEAKLCPLKTINIYKLTDDNAMLAYVAFWHRA